MAEMTPYEWHALLEGTAEVSEDLAEMPASATRIGGRYMGVDRAEAFGWHNAVPMSCSCG